MTPQRWQRRRTKGAQQPPHTRYCGRHNGYNPFANSHNIAKIGQYWYVWADAEWVRCADEKEAHTFSVVRYRCDMADLLAVDPAYYDDLLKYKYISCFCPLDLPCHCDAIIAHLQRREMELMK